MREIVEQVYVGEAGPPPGSLGRLCAVLDELRFARARVEDIAHVEQVSVGLHRLQGLLRTTGKDSVPAIVQRAWLHRSTVAWMQDAPLSEFA